MSGEKSKLEPLEQALVKLEDIENSYNALVEKMAKLQLQATEEGIDFLVNKVQEPFSHATNNAQKIRDLRKDIEIERNRLRSEQK